MAKIKKGKTSKKKHNKTHSLQSLKLLAKHGKKCKQLKTSEKPLKAHTN